MYTCLDITVPVWVLDTLEIRSSLCVSIYDRSLGVPQATLLSESDATVVDSGKEYTKAHRVSNRFMKRVTDFVSASVKDSTSETLSVHVSFSLNYAATHSKPTNGQFCSTFKVTSSVRLSCLKLLGS